MAVLQTKIFRGCILLSNKEAYPAFKGSGIQFIYKDKDYKSGDTVQIRWRPDSDSPAIWLSDTLTVSGTPAEPIFDWARSSGLNLPDKSAIQIWITRDGEEVYRTNICPLQRVDSKSGSSASQYRRVLTRSASEFTFNDSTIATAGEYSFYDCDGLTEVKINNVSRINNNAFAECDNLKDIWLLRNSVATLESVNAIPNTVENIWVPRDLEHTYEAAPVWKDLVDCEERIKPYPPEVVTLGHVDFQCTDEFDMYYTLADTPFLNEGNQPGKWDGQLFYSTDGVNWQEWSKVVAIDNIVSKLGADNKHHIYLRGIGNHKLTDTVETEQGTYWCGFGMGSIDPKISVVGKLENMFDCERVAAGAHPHMAANACHLLFSGDECNIGHIDNNFLSGLTPTAYCYAYMFANGHFKEEALKDLVFSDKIAPYCYAYMFQHCYHLHMAPALPATTLAEGCYKGMFSNIDELITPPVLSPAGTTVTLAEHCYEEMFRGDFWLASIPSIKATNFPAACCKKMFVSCGTILSETKTGDFQNYYRLPTEGEAVVASNAFEGMFDDVTVISGKSYYANKYVAPPIPEPIPNLCFTNIADSLDATITLQKVGDDTPARSILYSWNNADFEDYTVGAALTVNPGKKVYFKGDNSNGFSVSTSQYYQFATAGGSLKISGNIMSLIDNGACSRTDIPNDFCFYGLFQNCAMITTIPDLPAATLKPDCYYKMFENCTGLTDLSSYTLPALDLTAMEYCYLCMFQGCTSLIKTPAIAATKMGPSACRSMFSGCTNLQYTPELPATVLAGRCYESMFANCKHLRSIPSIQTTNFPDMCVKDMFGSTNLNITAEYASDRQYYRLPRVGQATITGSGLVDMFSGTTGVQDPNPNTLYYVNAESVTPPVPNMLYFYAEDGAATIKLQESGEPYAGTFSYRKFPDPNWIDYTIGTEISLADKDVLLFKGSCPEGTGGRWDDDYRYFSMTGKIYAGGNIMALIDNGACSTTEIPQSNCFQRLFAGCASLTHAPELPATTLMWRCYMYMFQGCTSLTTAPKLPATNLGIEQWCYTGMFAGCTALTTAPELPATTLSGHCYEQMFMNCTSLATAPVLPAAVNYCSYKQMFKGCTALTQAPVLSSMNLYDECYGSMFEGCTALTTAPELPAKSPIKDCYNSMFKGCTALKNIPSIQFTTFNAEACCKSMFQNTGLTLSTESSATHTKRYRVPASGTHTGDIGADAFKDMFDSGDLTIDINYYVNADSVTPEIPEYVSYFYLENATTANTSVNVTISKYGSITDPPTFEYNTGSGWSDYTLGDTIALANSGDRVQFKGTNTKIGPSAAAYCRVTADGYINAGGNIMTLLDPAGESVVLSGNNNFVCLFKGCGYLKSAADLKLPATTLVDSCYKQLFYGCTSLTTPPASLPATTAAGDSYYGMFEGCTSLASVPTMEVTSAASRCCSRMFYGCNNAGFTSAANITINTTASSSYDSMFSGCTSLTQAPALPATTLASSCYYAMFYGCTSLTQAPALPATTLADSCYYDMFSGCTSLTQAPALPATTLAQNCYRSMFLSCSYLITAPALPATTLAKSCYRGMFSACSRLQSAPAVLPAETLAEECYMRMFNGCSNITTAPEIKAVGAAANYCCERMFYGCSSLRNIPSLKVTDVSYSHMCELMFYNTGIRIWDNSGEGHTVKYRIPIEGTGGSVGSNAFNQMFSSGGDKVTPYINTVYYTNAATVTPPVPVDYLTFTANTAGSTIGVAVNGTPTRTLDLWYSTDRTSWTQYTPAASATMITLANVGDKIYWKGVNSNGFSESGGIYYQFKMTGSLAGSGNIMTLIDGTGDALTILNQYCFYYLFYGCTSLTSSPDLPATTITSYCYKEMFESCANLVTPPATLPAMKTYTDSYAMMFAYCSKLASIPTLPATSLSERSYYGMFMRCNALIDLSSYTLPAQTVAINCYQQMFDGCSGLTKAPGISATTVRDYGCGQMFQNCTSLTTVPSFSINEAYNNCCWRMFYGCNNAGFTNASGITIAATANSGYESMFEGCTYLTTPPALSATTLASSCYKNMFSGCTALTTAPTLSATTLAINCYSNMFKGCTKLTTAPTLSATTLAMSCYYSMFEGCTGLTSVPTFKATTVYNNCCWRMFYGCNKVTDASGITIAATANNSYVSMFEECTSLTTPPIITATTALQYCYYNMFKSCVALTTTHELLATTAGVGAYWGMYYGCTSLTTPAIIHATSYGADTCYAMFRGCTGIKVSATQGGGYEIPYSIPSSGTVTAVGDSFGDMFVETGGTFKGTPEIAVGGSWTGYLYGIVPDYLKFTAEQANSTVYVSRGNGTPKADNLQYRVNGSGSWLTYTLPDRSSSGASISLTSVGDYVEFRGNNPDGFNLDSSSFGNYYTFKGTGKLSASGGIMTLIGYDAKITTIPNEYCFTHLFFYNDVLTSAENLILSATTLKTGCYEFMFYGCSSLTAAPALPATTLYSYCYRNMFARCTSLTTPPALPATTLGMDCYKDMFLKCTSMTRIPSLPATTMVTQCYYWLFEDCSQLGFSTTKDSTYKYAFRCPSEGTLTTAENWNKEMFLGTATVGTIPYPEADTMYYCNVEVYPPVPEPVTVDYLTFTANEAGSTVALYKAGSPDEKSLEYSTDKASWISYVPGTTGDITLANVGDKVYFRGDNPSGLSKDATNYYYFGLTGSVDVSGKLVSILNSSGETTGVTLCNYCFYRLFGYQSSASNALRSAENLEIPMLQPSTYCYYQMFRYCAALTKAPAFPWNSTLTEKCYGNMFWACTSLTRIPSLPATTMGSRCYQDFFEACSQLGFSTTKDDTYKYAFRCPSEGTLVTASNWNTNMFYGTATASTILAPAADTMYYCNVEVYPPVPEPADYLDFSSDSAFSLKLDKAESGGTWDGTMQVGQIVSGELKWTTIDPDATRAAYTSSYISSENKHHVYLRGTGNTRLGSSSEKYNTITFPMGSGVKVKGNIQCLLDYENPGVTTLSDQWAFYNLFSGNTGLTDASELVLPYTTISANCYYNMFQNCTNLVTSPTSIPATVTKDFCCARMFYNCTSLTTAPSLPAASAAGSCYGNMFYGCSNLEQLPTLPATGSLGWRCYVNMFDSCTKIKLSETQTGEYQTAYRIPTTGSATDGGDSTYKMFLNTKGTWPGGDYGTAELGKTYYTSNTVV